MTTVGHMQIKVHADEWTHVVSAQVFPRRSLIQVLTEVDDA